MTRTGSKFTRTTAEIYFENVSKHDAQMLADHLPPWLNVLDAHGFHGVEYENKRRTFRITWFHSPETLQTSKVLGSAILVANTWGGAP